MKLPFSALRLAVNPDSLSYPFEFIRLEVYVKHWLVVLALALAPGHLWAQERVKIGFVDIQRVIAESQAGKRAKDRFQAQVKKVETELMKERQDLERLRNDIDKKGPLLRDDERRNMEAEFQKRSINLQRTMGDYQQDLRQRESEMMSEILKDLEVIVNEVGKSDKFTLILERSQILYSDKGIDITNKVIETYNSRIKK
jgi:outer membrane protein